MKALVYVEPKRAEMQDWPEPVPEAGEGLVRIHAAGVCGSDLHIWLGHSPNHPPPRVLGHELAGVLERMNGEAGPLKVGDRVTIFPHLGCGQCAYCAAGQDPLCRRKKTILSYYGGGFAEYVRMPLKNLYRFPERTDFVDATLIEPLACAVHAVGKCGESKGPIAILGAGPIGLSILFVARQLGFPKIAVAEVNVNRLEEARKQGADLTVNTRDEAGLEQLARFFGEDGCTAVFDAAGFAATRQLALRIVRTQGAIISLGLGETTTPVDFAEIIVREIRIQGCLAYSRQDFESAVRWVCEGRLRGTTWVSEAPLAEGQAIFEDLTSGTSSRIKTVLRI
jgi:threonine dehydrogenase-like Zn-dependent dehydrogenase